MPDVNINLPEETYIEYDLLLGNSNDPFDKSRPSFIIQENINKLLHGPCRNPHQDTLLAGDRLVGKTLTDAEQRLALLLMITLLYTQAT